MNIKRNEKMEKQKEVNITKKLQDLVKKTNIIVIKAGSIKTSKSNSSGSSVDYYPASSDE